MLWGRTTYHAPREVHPITIARQVQRPTLIAVVAVLLLAAVVE